MLEVIRKKGSPDYERRQVVVEVLVYYQVITKGCDIVLGRGRISLEGHE